MCLNGRGGRISGRRQYCRRGARVTSSPTCSTLETLCRPCRQTAAGLPPKEAAKSVVENIIGWKTGAFQQRSDMLVGPAKAERLPQQATGYSRLDKRDVIHRRISHTTNKRRTAHPRTYNDTVQDKTSLPFSLAGHNKVSPVSPGPHVSQNKFLLSPQRHSAPGSRARPAISAISVHPVPDPVQSLRKLGPLKAPIDQKGHCQES
jgi:hypothetical protein